MKVSYCFSILNSILFISNFNLFPPVPPSDGLVWGIQKNQCDWPTDEACGTRPITINMKPGNAVQKCNCPGGAKDCYYADINNCNGFFQCSKGTAHRVSSREVLFEVGGKGNALWARIEKNTE